MAIDDNRWVAVYISLTSFAKRYVKVEDERDAEEAFSSLYHAGGDFKKAVDTELLATDSFAVEWDAEEDPFCNPNPNEAISEEAGTRSLAEWRRKASMAAEEMRFGDIVARRWGSGDVDYQGLKIGFYDADGGFTTVAIVEVDRMNDRAEEQVKIHVWSDDVDDDPTVQVDWVGAMPGEPAGES